MLHLPNRPGSFKHYKGLDRPSVVEATRQYLNERLAHTDELAGLQPLKVIRRLKDIATAMQQYVQAGRGAGCSGLVSSDEGGLMTVSTAPDGHIVVTCN